MQANIHHKKKHVKKLHIVLFSGMTVCSILGFVMFGSFLFLSRVEPSKGAATPTPFSISSDIVTPAEESTTNLPPEVADKKQLLNRAQQKLARVLAFAQKQKQTLDDSATAVGQEYTATLGQADNALVMIQGTFDNPSLADNDRVHAPVQIEQKKVRNLALKALRYYSVRVGTNFVLSTPGYDITFKPLVGVKDGNTKLRFISAAKQLSSDLSNPDTVPEDDTLVFFDATEQLLLASVGVVPSPDPTIVPDQNVDGITRDDLNTLRDTLHLDWTDFLKAMGDYNETKSAYRRARYDHDVAAANEAVETREKLLDLQQKQFDLDESIASARADVDDAQAAYDQALRDAATSSTTTAQ